MGIKLYIATLIKVFDFHTNYLKNLIYGYIWLDESIKFIYTNNTYQLNQ